MAKEKKKKKKEVLKPSAGRVSEEQDDHYQSHKVSSSRPLVSISLIKQIETDFMRMACGANVLW